MGLLYQTGRFQVFISLVGIQLLKVPWVLWIVVEMPSVTTLFQAQEFGSNLELGARTV